MCVCVGNATLARAKATLCVRGDTTPQTGTPAPAAGQAAGARAAPRGHSKRTGHTQTQARERELAESRGPDCTPGKDQDNRSGRGSPANVEIFDVQTCGVPLRPRMSTCANGGTFTTADDPYVNLITPLCINLYSALPAFARCLWSIAAAFSP